MGELTRKGETRPATPEDLALYERAQSMQALQEVPVLQRADDPHEYLFFALFDGTSQDANNPKQALTNVGVLKKQLDLLTDNPDLRIGGQYIEGIGTQSNPLTRYADAWIPYTWDDKIEEAYRALSDQTYRWKQKDPEAEVRLAEVGYSRGAVLAAGLARLVDEYGIAHPKDLSFGRDAHGNITVESTRPPLVAPGQVAQAMGLYDPVATNMPEAYDARRAPSVISATAFAARDEDRVAFPHQTILEPGLSPDRRFANLLVPGGHSNVGGGNGAPGLEAGAFNLLADYLNALRDEPLFRYRPLPDDPAAYTVYQAHGPTALPGMDRDGLRDLRPDLASCKIVDPCRDGEPVDQALAGRFEYRRLQPAAPVPAPSHLRQEAAQTMRPAQATPVQTSPPALPADFAPPMARQPADIRDPSHLGHGAYRDMLEKVHAFDAQNGHASGPHSERLAAALVAMAAQERLSIGAVSTGPNGQPQIEVRVRAADSYLMQTRTRPIDAHILADRPIEDSSQAYLQARSPHFLSRAPVAERTPEQVQALAQLAPGDQILFARLRERLPAHLSDDLALRATLEAKRAGVETPDRLQDAVVVGDTLHVAGTIPGFRASVDLTQPAPPAQQTLQQVQQYNLQREQELAASRTPDDPTRGGPTR